MSADGAPVVPEPCRVLAFQNQLDRAQLQGTSRDDIYIVGSKVLLPNAKGAGGEWSFDGVFGKDTLPMTVARAAVPAAVDAVLTGLNHLLLVLGASGSGKAELLEGTSPSGSGNESRWEGLAENLIKALYAGVRDTLDQGVKGTSCRLQLQFLHIVEERVQDLLEPDCHSHDLELVEDEEAGTLVRDAEPEELKGEAHAVGLYRQGIQSLRSLARYHEVDIDAACSILTLTLTQLHPLYTAAASANPSGISSPAFASRRASVSIVSLPGTERLQRGQQHAMQVIEGPFKARSITQFADLVGALARRGPRPQHVTCGSGKLVQLVHQRLGGNARVVALATLKAGQPAESVATLKCAAELRRVLQYPLVNSECARGLLALRRSELLALREDVQAMQLRGVPPPAQPIDPSADALRAEALLRAESARDEARRAAPAESVTAQEAPAEGSGKESERQPAGSGGEAAGEGSAEDATPPVSGTPATPTLPAPPAHGGAWPTPDGAAAADTSAKAGDDRLAQSERVGQQLTVELLQARLKEQRVAARQEKDHLNAQIRALGEQVGQLHREKLQEQSEKLRAAKALVELEVDGQGLVDAKEAEAAELEARLDQARAQKDAAEAETRRARAELAASKAALEAELLKRQHAEDEMLAARYTLEQARGETDGWAADKGELEAEVVSSVNQARQREAQVAHLTASLDEARRETLAARSEAHEHAARADEAAAEQAALERARTEAAARAEALGVELSREKLQHELAVVAHDKERVQLHDQLRRQEAKAAADERLRAEEALVASKGTGAGTSGTDMNRALRAARLEVAELRVLAGEATDRADAAEAEAKAADERAARARTEYRALLSQGIGAKVAARPAPPAGARYAAEAEQLDGAIAELHAALLRNMRAGEAEAQAQLARLKERYASLRSSYSGLADGGLRSAGGQAGMAGGAAPAKGDGDDTERGGREAAELQRRVAALEKDKHELALKMEEAAAVYSRTVAQLRGSKPRAEHKAAERPADAMAAAVKPQVETGRKLDEEARHDAELLRAVQRLHLEKAELQKQLDRRKASEAHMTELTAEIESLRGERGDYKKDYNELMSERTAKVQLRELASSMAALESERSKLIRRATSAEEQLNALQGAMSTNILTYQKEIIRLRKALQQAGVKQLQQ